MMDNEVSPANSNMTIIIGSVAGGIAVLVLVFGVVFALMLYKRKQRRNSTHHSVEMSAHPTNYVPIDFQNEYPTSTDKDLPGKEIIQSTLRNSIQKEVWIIDYESIEIEKEIGRGGNICLLLIAYLRN